MNMEIDTLRLVEQLMILFGGWLVITIGNVIEFCEFFFPERGVDDPVGLLVGNV